jgi:hypothetical protein
MVRKHGMRGRGRAQEAESRGAAGASLDASASARDPVVDKARRTLGVAQYTHRTTWMTPTEGLVYQERVAARVWEEISAEDWSALGFPAPALLDPVFARGEDWAALRRAEPRSFATAHALLDLVDPARGPNAFLLTEDGFLQYEADLLDEVARGDGDCDRAAVRAFLYHHLITVITVGGARRGAAPVSAPAAAARKVQINFRAYAPHIRAFDKAAYAAGLSRTDWMTKALIRAARAEGVNLAPEGEPDEE